jgi:Metalloenzyme superfamily
VDRAGLEAASRQLQVPPGAQVWRVDVHEGAQRATTLAVRDAVARLRAELPRHTVQAIGGHRLLICGPAPLPEVIRRTDLRVWPRGVLPPRVLGPDTVVIAAAGAAAGAGRMMGATVVVPPGATGGPDTDLRAKARAAVEALGHATRVVVHVGGADEAAHARHPEVKVAVLERIDRELLGPLGTALGQRGGRLTICPDHGCDPTSGEHDSAPVPCLSWPATRSSPGARLTERQVAGLPVSTPGDGYGYGYGQVA